MLTHNDIQRSLGKMMIDLTTARQTRARRADAYGLAERQFQTQFEFSGKIGVLPTEMIVPIRFSIAFLADAGNQRESWLDRPHANLTFELLFGPSGMLTYGHVDSWLRDDDFNYIGAKLLIGVHTPGLEIGGFMPTQFTFKGIVHASFQGYGAVIDGDEILSTSDATSGEVLA